MIMSQVYTQPKSQKLKPSQQWYHSNERVDHMHIQPMIIAGKGCKHFHWPKITHNQWQCIKTRIKKKINLNSWKPEKDDIKEVNLETSWNHIGSDV